MSRRWLESLCWTVYRQQAASSFHFHRLKKVSIARAFSSKKYLSERTCRERCLFFSARPDPVTISYFAKIVSLCTGEDTDYDDAKGERLLDIMTTLAMSETELNDCFNEKSIRATCRNLVRLCFKQELKDNSIHFGAILKDKSYKSQIAAIHGKLTCLQSIDDMFSTSRIRATHASARKGKVHYWRTEQRHGEWFLSTGQRTTPCPQKHSHSSKRSARQWREWWWIDWCHSNFSIQITAKDNHSLWVVLISRLFSCIYSRVLSPCFFSKSSH